MRLRSATLIVFAALTVSSGHASDSEGLRLRERLPARGVGDAQPSETRTPAERALTAAAEDRVWAAPKAIRLEGAVAIPQDDFEPIFSRYVGRGLTRRDLVALTREVTDAYRAQGYFLSRAVVPPQSATDGVLAVRVEEGRFVAVEFETDGEELRDFFDQLLAEVPARKATLERAILTLGDLSGVTVQSSETIPVEGARGEYILRLRVALDRADGLLFVDNRGEGGGEALQAVAQAGANGLGIPGSRVEVNVFTDPRNPARAQFVEVSATAPLGLRGTIVGVTASAVNSAEGEFGAGRIRQQGTDIALSLRHAAIRTRAASMWLNLEVAQSTGDASLENLGLNRDELTMARLGVEAELRDGWGGRTRLNLGATFGRDDFKTPTPAHPMARPDDGAAFTKFTLIANRTQTLADGWSLFAAMRGQVSADDLPEDERITFGGARWGRAYDYSEIEGDTGIAGQLEVRYTSNGLKLVDSLQTYAFADAAASWVRDGEGEADTLSSAGLGLRADFGLGYRAGVEAAVPLNRLPLGQTDRHPRVFATVSREF